MRGLAYAIGAPADAIDGLYPLVKATQGLATAGTVFFGLGCIAAVIAAVLMCGYSCMRSRGTLAKPSTLPSSSSTSWRSASSTTLGSFTSAVLHLLPILLLSVASLLSIVAVFIWAAINARALQGSTRFIPRLDYSFGFAIVCFLLGTVSVVLFACSMGRDRHERLRAKGICEAKQSQYTEPLTVVVDATASSPAVHSSNNHPVGGRTPPLGTPAVTGSDRQLHSAAYKKGSSGDGDATGRPRLESAGAAPFPITAATNRDGVDISGPVLVASTAVAVPMSSGGRGRAGSLPRDLPPRDDHLAAATGLAQRPLPRTMLPSRSESAEPSVAGLTGTGPVDAADDDDADEVTPILHGQLGRNEVAAGFTGS